MSYPPDAAERSVIGAVFLQNEALKHITLVPLDFTHAARRALWTAILELDQAEQPIDAVTVPAQLNGRGGDHIVEELTLCIGTVPTADNVEFYGQIVKAASVERDLRLGLSELATLARDERHDVDELLARARRLLERSAKPAEAEGTKAGNGVPRRRTPAELVALINARAAEPWVCLGLNGAEIARLRLGSCAAIIGGSGAGKSSLVAALLEEHARLHGPAVYLSFEMGSDEVAARNIGMKVSASWEDVLRGRVPADAMEAALPPRLAIFDRDEEDLTVDQLVGIVAELSAAHPGEPILAAIDYIQLAAGDGPEVRMNVARLVEAIRKIARRLRIVTIGVSQTSRVNARALRAGELVGAETMAAGAESSGIEQRAYITLAIGTQGPAREDGFAPVELNIGKGRFGGGDRVLPMAYDGRTGQWRVAGDSRPAADVAAERAVKNNAEKVQAAKDSMLAAAGRADKPQSREELRKATSIGRTLATAAVNALLEGRLLVECEKAPRSTSRLLWTPERAAARDAERAAADARRTGDQ